MCIFFFNKLLFKSTYSLNCFTYSLKNLKKRSLYKLSDRTNYAIIIASLCEIY